MKKHVIVLTAILGMTASATMFTGCSRPTAREAEINSKITSKLFEIGEIADLSNPPEEGAGLSVYTQGGEKTLALSGSFSQTKLEGSSVEKLLKKVSSERSKTAINDQLKAGAIAIVVLDDQVKILKVVAETSNSMDANLTSLSYVNKLKALSKTADAQAQAALVTELDSLKYQSPSQLGETFGLVEVTALKVEKHGVLDNEKTDYNEAKSILNISEKPFAVSTHILVGEEVGAPKKASDKASGSEE